VWLEKGRKGRENLMDKNCSC